jgi:hypothetical protein
MEQNKMKKIELLQTILTNPQLTYNIKSYKIDKQQWTKQTITIYEFSDTIDEYYWIHYSNRKDKLVGNVRLKSGMYAFIKIKNVYNGIDSPKIRIYTADSNDLLLSRGLKDGNYKKYKKITPST